MRELLHSRAKLTRPMQPHSFSRQMAALAEQARSFFVKRSDLHSRSKLFVASEAGKGSVFTVRLPVSANT
jgi:hypothetical protein